MTILEGKFAKSRKHNIEQRKSEDHLHQDLLLCTLHLSLVCSKVSNMGMDQRIM